MSSRATGIQFISRNRCEDSGETILKGCVSQEDFLKVMSGIVNGDWRGCLDFDADSDCHTCHDVDVKIWFGFEQDIDMFMTLNKDTAFMKHGDVIRARDDQDDE